MDGALTLKKVIAIAIAPLAIVAMFVVSPGMALALAILELLLIGLIVVIMSEKYEQLLENFDLEVSNLSGRLRRSQENERQIMMTHHEHIAKNVGRPLIVGSEYWHSSGEASNG